MENIDIKETIKNGEVMNSEAKKESGSIFGFFIRNFRFTYVLLFGLVVAGVFSFATLPREAEPEIKIPYAAVTTVFLGSTPSDTEELITDKIEDGIKDLEGLKMITSNSGSGVSSIFVEFEPSADINESVKKLKDAVDKVKSKLPSEAEDPMVGEMNFTDTPIVTYSLVGDRSDEELKKYAEILKSDLEGISGVSRVEVSGAADREFLVTLDPARMERYSLGFSQVSSAISAANVSLPAGSLKMDGFEYGLRVSGKFVEATDLNDVVVTTYEGSPVLLSDVGLVTDGFKEKKTISRVAIGQDDAKGAISLQVFKKTGGNILRIVKEADALVANDSNSSRLPSDIKILKTNDNSEFIKEDLSILGLNALQTFLLVGLILFLFLTASGAVITALSIPLAFLISFVYLKLSGMTINSMVLFALVLSLGLMVDNSVVVIEGFTENLRKKGQRPLEAALSAIAEYKWPVISGTMTTVAAFTPMLLVSGIMGEYLSIIPKTINATLLSSLFVALIILPTLASRLIKNGHTEKRKFDISEKIMPPFSVFYRRIMNKVLSERRLSRTIIISSWVLFFLAVAMPIVGVMKIEMFPKVDFDYFYINIKLPPGSTLEQTDAITRKAESYVSPLPELSNYVVSVGRNQNANGGSSGSNKSNITVNLVKDDERSVKSYDIAAYLRSELEDINGAEVTVDELSAGPPSGSPIEARITGSDGKKLGEVAAKIEAYLASNPEVFNIKNSLEDSAGEFVFKVDKEKADHYGLSPLMIAGILRAMVFGSEAATVSYAGDDVPVVLKYPEEAISTPDDIMDISILSPSGVYVPIKQVASVSLESSLLSIEHRDGERIIAVSADAVKGANVSKISSDLLAATKDMELPEGVKVAVGGEMEDIEKSFRETFYSMIVAVILIFGILILQFNSFKKPLIVLLSLPLSIIGVIAGLILFGEAFSFPAFIGIVSLTGIAVNNAIVLIDKINRNIESGMDMDESLIDAGISRFQPILLTSTTTIIGIMSLMTANEVWKGLAITIASGMVASTTLILVVVPIMYRRFGKEKV